MINYEAIYRQSVKMQISAHLLVKREIGYRIKTQQENGCRFCANLRLIGEQNITQCSIIGEGFDPYCRVDYDHICKCYIGMPGKNLYSHNRLLEIEQRISSDDDKTNETE